METILIVLAIILLLGVKVSFAYYRKPKPKNTAIQADPIKKKYRIVDTGHTSRNFPGYTYYLFESSNDGGSVWRKEYGKWVIEESAAKLEFMEYLDNQNKKPIVVQEFEA